MSEQNALNNSESAIGNYKNNNDINNEAANNTNLNHIENSMLKNINITDIGINTSALDPEELKRLVENNPELLEEINNKSIISKRLENSGNIDNINTQSDENLLYKNQKLYIEKDKQSPEAVAVLKKQDLEKEKIMLQKKKRQKNIDELDEKEYFNFFMLIA